MTLDDIDLLDLDRFQRLEHHEMFRQLRAEDAGVLARRAERPRASGTSSSTPTCVKVNRDADASRPRSAASASPTSTTRAGRRGIDPRGLMMLYMDPPQAHPLPHAGPEGLHAPDDRAARAVPHAPGDPHRRQHHRAGRVRLRRPISPPSCRCRRSPRSWACRRRSARCCSTGRTSMIGIDDPEYAATTAPTPRHVPSSTCTATSSASSAGRPARRHRHQADQRRDRGRQAVRARVRHVHAAAHGRRQRDHPQHDLVGHVGADAEPGPVQGARRRPRASSTGRIEEILRWATPVYHFRRTALNDTVIHGQEIKKGDKVVMWHTSADRDEDRVRRSVHVRHRALAEQAHRLRWRRRPLLPRRQPGPHGAAA